MKKKKDFKNYHRRYQAINRDKLKEYDKDYCKENKESIKLRKAKYYKKKKEEYHKRYLERKEQKRIKEMMDNYYRNNLTTVDIWGERKRENQKRYRKNRRIKIFNKFNGRCAYCGQKIKIENFEIDHKIPKIAGEKEIHEYKNLVPACKTCNSIKNNLTIEEFRSDFFKGKNKKFYFENT